MQERTPRRYAGRTRKRKLFAASALRSLAHVLQGSVKLTAAIKDREARQTHLERELGALEGRERVSQTELARIEQLAHQKVSEWRGVLKKRTPQTRQVLAKLLRDRLVFVPERRNGRDGNRFHGNGSIIKLLSGVVPELDGREAVASPTGTALNYLSIFRGEFVIRKRAA